MLPAFEQIVDRLAKGRIGFDQLVVELALQPRLQIVHRWLAMSLVMRQALFARHAFFTSNLVVVIDDLECLDHVTALVGKPIVDVHEVAAAVGQAIRQDRVQFLGQIPRKSVTHLNRRVEFCRTMLQDIRQVLARMLASAEEQRNPIARTRGDHARSKQAGAIGIVRVVCWWCFFDAVPSVPES